MHRSVLLESSSEACALQAHQVQVEKTALNLAEHTLWALQKGSDTQKELQDPPMYARPAVEPPQQSPQPQKRTLSRIPKLTASKTFEPRLTAGWAPKVRLFAPACLQRVQFTPLAPVSHVLEKLRLPL